MCEFDLVGVPNTYAVDCPLIVDVGGNDTYTNNAGGVNGGAAAVIDLGGDDRYAGNRASGANGGGSAGAGFLFDAEATTRTLRRTTRPTAAATSSVRDYSSMLEATTGTRRRTPGRTGEGLPSVPER